MPKCTTTWPTYAEATPLVVRRAIPSQSDFEAAPVVSSVGTLSRSRCFLLGKSMFVMKMCALVVCVCCCLYKIPIEHLTAHAQRSALLTFWVHRLSMLEFAWLSCVYGASVYVLHLDGQDVENECHCEVQMKRPGYSSFERNESIGGHQLGVRSTNQCKRQCDDK